MRAFLPANHGAKTRRHPAATIYYIYKHKIYIYIYIDGDIRYGVLSLSSHLSHLPIIPFVPRGARTNIAQSAVYDIRHRVPTTDKCRAQTSSSIQRDGFVFKGVKLVFKPPSLYCILLLTIRYLCIISSSV